MTTAQATARIQNLMTALKTEELKSFINTCPTELVNFVLDELEKRMTEEEFIKFSNEF